MPFKKGQSGSEKHKFPNNDPTKGGRNPSIKNQLKELMKKEGTVKVSAKQVKKIHDDGSVDLKLPTQMQMAMKLSGWAMSRKGNDSLKAIKMIMEQIDGMPTQSTKTEHSGQISDGKANKIEVEFRDFSEDDE